MQKERTNRVSRVSPDPFAIFKKILMLLKDACVLECQRVVCTSCPPVAEVDYFQVWKIYNLFGKINMHVLDKFNEARTWIFRE
jgi:hypothetical protein